MTIKIELQDLALFWRGRAKAFRAVHAQQPLSDATVRAAEIYETCADEIKAALGGRSPAAMGGQVLGDGNAPQMDRVFIGKGEYVRADEATKTIMGLQRNLRHWREECGKLHAKLAHPAASATQEALQCVKKHLDDLGSLKGWRLEEMRTKVSAALAESPSQPATYPDLREECANLDYLNKSYQERIALLESQVEGLTRLLEMAQECIRGETPEDMSHEDARQYVLEKIRTAITSTDRS